MTHEQFAALAQLMGLKPSAHSEALRLVLVDGFTHQAAAEQAATHRPNVTRGVTKARAVIKLVRQLSDVKL